MRRRESRKFWTKVVDECEGTSGETHAEVAARRGVEKTTFQRWLYILRLIAMIKTEDTIKKQPSLPWARLQSHPNSIPHDFLPLNVVVREETG